MSVVSAQTWTLSSLLRYKLDFVFTMNADDLRRDGEPEDWLAFFRERPGMGKREIISNMVP